MGMKPPRSRPDQLKGSLKAVVLLRRGSTVFLLLMPGGTVADRGEDPECPDHSFEISTFSVANNEIKRTSRDEMYSNCVPQ